MGISIDRRVPALGIQALGITKPHRDTTDLGEKLSLGTEVQSQFKSE